MRFDVTTDASPGQVLQALTDFTERRPRIWHRTLDPKTYELRELGGTWAVARESTAGSPFWVVERYDWSDPSVVRWADLETSWGGLGSGEVHIVPLDGGGSRIEARWTNGGATRMRDKVLLWLLHRGPMHRVIARMWRKTLDEYARARRAAVRPVGEADEMVVCAPAASPMLLDCERTAEEVAGNTHALARAHLQIR